MDNILHILAIFAVFGIGYFVVIKFDRFLNETFRRNRRYSAPEGKIEKYIESRNRHSSMLKSDHKEVKGEE